MLISARCTRRGETHQSAAATSKISAQGAHPRTEIRPETSPSSALYYTPNNPRSIIINVALFQDEAPRDAKSTRMLLRSLEVDMEGINKEKSQDPDWLQLKYLSDHEVNWEAS
jgi:hypothetical protein